MNRLIEAALKKIRQMKEGKSSYPDDDVFVIVRGQGARLMDMDTSVHHNTLKPQKLLKNDGTVVREVVQSVRRVSPQSPDRNAGFASGANLLTVRSFLSANAIRVTNSMDQCKVLTRHHAEAPSCSPQRSWYSWDETLMTHSVNDVIDAKFKSLIGKVDRVEGLGRPFPVVTDVVVEVDNQLQSPRLV